MNSIYPEHFSTPRPVIFLRIDTSMHRLPEMAKHFDLPVNKDKQPQSMRSCFKHEVCRFQSGDGECSVSHSVLFSVFSLPFIRLSLSLSLSLTYSCISQSLYFFHFTILVYILFSLFFFKVYTFVSFSLWSFFKFLSHRSICSHSHFILIHWSILTLFPLAFFLSLLGISREPYCFFY